MKSLTPCTECVYFRDGKHEGYCHIDPPVVVGVDSQYDTVNVTETPSMIRTGETMWPLIRGDDKNIGCGRGERNA